jgi:hypothetical protein
MRQQQLGQALFDVGCHAAGWTAAILFIFGGATFLFHPGNIENPFVHVLAWGQVVVLGSGLVLMAVGHVLRKVVGDPSSPPELADRVLALEREVARLRAVSVFLSPEDEKPPPATEFRKPPAFPN